MEDVGHGRDGWAVGRLHDDIDVRALLACVPQTVGLHDRRQGVLDENVLKVDVDRLPGQAASDEEVDAGLLRHDLEHAAQRHARQV